MNTSRQRAGDTPLSTQQACEYLDVSPSTLYALVAKKQLESRKPGGKKRYFWKRDLDAWIDSKSRITNKSRG